MPAAQHRHEFETATFRILFAACDGCDPHLTLSLEPLERAAPFGKAEQARKSTEHDVLSYRPLYFRSRVVEGYAQRLLVSADENRLNWKQLARPRDPSRTSL